MTRLHPNPLASAARKIQFADLSFVTMAHPACPPACLRQATLPSPGRLASLILAALGLVLGGCATAPVTHKATADARTKIASMGAITLAPPDIVVSELTVGGIQEIRDEWGATVTEHMISALTARGDIKRVATLSEESRAELDEVTALLRIIAASRLAALFDAPQLQKAWNTNQLNFNVGRIDRILESTGGEAVLLLFVRDSYATAGRKSLAVLSILAGAVTGVYIVPTMGSTQMCAALVERDGDVLWFNTLAAGFGDLREQSAAKTTTDKLMTGWPGR